MSEQKRLSLAGVGCGSRTRTYMKLAMEQKNRYRIAAAADPVKQRTEAVRDFAPEEERASMQTLKADITFYPDEALSGLNDDFSRTVCYDSIARALRAEAMARPRKLVETLAEDMGKVCLKEFGARHVVVTLRKFILPRTDSVSVTVHVSRHR